MAKIDLTSPEWCELIFKGKNKAYGAFKMRSESPKRHNLAMVIVLVIALVGFSIPTLIKIATPKQKEVMTEVTTFWAAMGMLPETRAFIAISSLPVSPVKMV